MLSALSAKVELNKNHVGVQSVQCVGFRRCSTCNNSLCGAPPHGRILQPQQTGGYCVTTRALHAAMQGINSSSNSSGSGSGSGCNVCPVPAKIGSPYSMRAYGQAPKGAKRPQITFYKKTNTEGCGNLTSAVPRRCWRRLVPYPFEHQQQRCNGTMATAAAPSAAAAITVALPWPCQLLCCLCSPCCTPWVESAMQRHFLTPAHHRRHATGLPSSVVQTSAMTTRHPRVGS